MSVFSWICAHAYVGVPTCTHECLRDVWGSLRLTLSSFLSLSTKSFGSVFQWTWSSWILPGCPMSLRYLPVSTNPHRVTGTQLTQLLHGCWNLNSSLPAWLTATLHTEPSPVPDTNSSLGYGIKLVSSLSKMFASMLVGALNTSFLVITLVLVLG